MYVGDKSILSREVAWPLQLPWMKASLAMVWIRPAKERPPGPHPPGSRPHILGCFEDHSLLSQRIWVQVRPTTGLKSEQPEELAADPLWTNPSRAGLHAPHHVSLLSSLGRGFSVCTGHGKCLLPKDTYALELNREWKQDYEK